MYKIYIKGIGNGLQDRVSGSYEKNMVAYTWDSKGKLEIVPVSR